MSSASPGATHRKPTRRPGRKAPTLRPESNTSVTAGVRVVIYDIFFSVAFMIERKGIQCLRVVISKHIKV